MYTYLHHTSLMYDACVRPAIPRMLGRAFRMHAPLLQCGRCRCRSDAALAEDVGQFAQDRFLPLAETLLTSALASTAARDHFTSRYLPCQDVSFYFSAAIARAARRGVLPDAQVRSCPPPSSVDVRLLLRSECREECRSI